LADLCAEFPSAIPTVNNGREAQAGLAARKGTGAAVIALRASTAAAATSATPAPAQGIPKASAFAFACDPSVQSLTRFCEGSCPSPSDEDFGIWHGPGSRHTVGCQTVRCPRCLREFHSAYSRAQEIKALARHSKTCKADGGGGGGGANASCAAAASAATAATNAQEHVDTAAAAAAAAVSATPDAARAATAAVAVADGAARTGVSARAAEGDAAQSMALVATENGAPVGGAIVLGYGVTILGRRNLMGLVDFDRDLFMRVSVLHLQITHVRGTSECEVTALGANKISVAGTCLSKNESKTMRTGDKLRLLAKDEGVLCFTLATHALAGEETAGPGEVRWCPNAVQMYSMQLAGAMLPEQTLLLHVLPSTSVGMIKRAVQAQQSAASAIEADNFSCSCTLRAFLKGEKDELADSRTMAGMDLPHCLFFLTGEEPTGTAHAAAGGHSVDDQATAAITNAQEHVGPAAAAVAAASVAVDAARDSRGVKRKR
jgi:hypothetical protein